MCSILFFPPFLLIAHNSSWTEMSQFLYLYSFIELIPISGRDVHMNSCMFNKNNVDVLNNCFPKSVQSCIRLLYCKKHDPNAEAMHERSYFCICNQFIESKWILSAQDR